MRNNKNRNLEKVVKQELKLKNSEAEQIDEELAFTQQSMINKRVKCSDDETCYCECDSYEDSSCQNQYYSQNASQYNNQSTQYASQYATQNSRYNNYNNSCSSSQCSTQQNNCCCKQSMRDALSKVLNQLSQIDGLVKFDQFAFVGDSFMAGATYQTAMTNGDNLNIASTTGDTNATFNCFEPCNLDILNISAQQITPLYAGSTAVALDKPISKVSLCDLDAIVFNLDLTTLTTANQNCCPQQSVQSLLKSVVDKIDYDCCEESSDDCCCSQAILKTLAYPCSFTSPSVGLTAGSLAVENVKLLGIVCNAIILYNPNADGAVSPTAPTLGRIYIVCLNSVGFML